VNKLSKEIHEVAKGKGFWDTERNIGEMLMLIVSEVSEALEADRAKKYADIKYYEEYPSKENFELHIKDTFESELADTIIRILDLCGAYDIDIDWHIRAKIDYNKKRGKLHGKAY